jgi:death-on-curing protein
MRFLSLGEVLALYKRVMEQSGGGVGVRDYGALESALAQPGLTYAGQELYPSLLAKVAALGFSLVGNHPFLDGNKRIGHAVMEVTLVLNGYEIDAPVDDQERVILSLAAGELDRDELLSWLERHTVLVDQGA